MQYGYHYKRLSLGTSGKVTVTELMVNDSHGDPMTNLLPNTTRHYFLLSFFHKNGCPYDLQNDSDRNHPRNHNNAIPKAQNKPCIFQQVDYNQNTAQVLVASVVLSFENIFPHLSECKRTCKHPDNSSILNLCSKLKTASIITFSIT